MNNMNVDICGVKLKNPVIAASGTFGFGREYGDMIDLNSLGGISVKGLTLLPRKGNIAPRIAETPAGMLNSVGLQNPGIEVFLNKELPFLRGYNMAVIANIAGNTVEEYCEMARLIGDSCDLIELNISCPNVKQGGAAFGTNEKSVLDITNKVKKYCKVPLIVKLTPNVTDIVSIAKAAEEGGADGISLINTLLGMRIDINKRKPVLGNIMGGLSGPAVKPVAVRMVYQVAKAVGIPVIGMGGITTWEDGIEFILAGADAIQVGAASFSNPFAMNEIIDGMKVYCDKNNIDSINKLKGDI